MTMPLILILVGLYFMTLDPTVPQVAKTITWVALVVIGIVLGGLSFLKVG